MWALIVDNDGVENVRREARACGVRIVACPAVVNEALRTPNTAVRRRLVRAMTLQSWERLMPEAFMEAEEVRRTISRLHADWLNPLPDRVEWQQLKADWQSGWWRRVRRDPDGEAARVRFMGQADLDLARSQSAEVRSHAVEQGRHFEHVSFDVNVIPSVPTPWWDGLPLQLWKAEGEGRWWKALTSPGSAENDWLGPWINMEAVRRQEWFVMWARELAPEDVPLAWLRWAFGFVQATRKTTSGTPVDNQIATYLPECDVFLTADRAFAECVEKVRPHAPVAMGRGHTLRAGTDPLPAIVGIIREIGEDYAHRQAETIAPHGPWAHRSQRH